MSIPVLKVQPGQYRILNLEPEGYCREARAVLERLGEISDGPLCRRELLERIRRYRPSQLAP